MSDKFEQYKVEPDAFWQALPLMGVDGYDAIGLAQKRRWHVIPSWGRDGYDLGNWPLVIVFVRNRDGKFEVAEYVEGDVTVYLCPTNEIRTAIIDGIAFYHWKWSQESWVDGIESVDYLPEELKGPCRLGER